MCSPFLVVEMGSHFFAGLHYYDIMWKCHDLELFCLHNVLSDNLAVEWNSPVGHVSSLQNSPIESNYSSFWVHITYILLGAITFLLSEQSCFLSK